MKNIVYKEIMLPEHEQATGIHTCHVCHGNMTPCTQEHTFDLPRRNAKVKVSGIHAHKCAECGEVIYSSAEAELIENSIKSVLGLD